MANNLDRLFREGVDQLEITPQTQSWKQIQSQLAGKKKYGWVLSYSIAATFIILIAATIVVINYREDTSSNHYGYVLADHPVEQKIFSLNIKDQRRTTPQGVHQKQESRTVAMTAPQHKASNINQASNKTINNNNENLSNFPTLSIAGIQPKELETSHPNTHPLSNTGFEHKSVATIRIIHIAGNSKENEQSVRIGNIITSFSKGASASNILAGIRDAKDNLLRKN